MASRIIVSDDSDSSDSEDMPTTTAGKSDGRQVYISSDSDSDSNNSDEDDTMNHELLDLEARDSDDDDDDEEDQEEDVDDLESGHGPDFDFPQFLRLPYELRLHIWECFCPDLYGSPRFLDLNVIDSSDPEIGWYPTDGMYLADQTKTTRIVLAVHRESRKFALTKFPDTFTLNYARYHMVPFNKENDVVYLGRDNLLDSSMDLPAPPPIDFCLKMRNVALRPIRNMPEMFLEPPRPEDITTIIQFPNLRRLYTYRSIDYADHKEIWIESDHCSWLTMMPPSHDASEPPTLVCMHKDVACDGRGQCYGLAGDPAIGFFNPERDLAPRSDLDDPEGPPADDADLMERLRSIRKLPLLVYENAFGRIGSGKVTVVEPEKGSSGLRIVPEGEFSDASDSDGASDEENEYESEGIDDDPVAEPETEDEDHGTGIEDDTFAMELLGGEGEQAEGAGFSPVQVSDSETLDEPDSDTSAPASPSKRSRARRVILEDSDEEEEEGETEEEQEAEPSARGQKRRRVVSDDEDDEDDSDGVRPTKRRAPLQEDDSDVEEIGARPRGNQRAPIILESDDSDRDGRGGALGSETSEEDEEDEEDESSEEDEPPKTLSLAERLRMHREANPVPKGSDDGDEDSDEQSDVNDGYGDDSEDEDGGGALVDNMADDDDDSEGDEDDNHRYR